MDRRWQVWFAAKNFLGTPKKGGPAKNLYTKSERVTVVWGLKGLIGTVGR